MAGMRTNSKFLSGVVEGFYGRPWTTGQRLDLFSRMLRWGLNTYLYAPKDDEKHRACWRDPYLLDEANQLSQLIREASERGIDFVYAIAPGLDMTFSSEREVAALKQKLNQLVTLGCRSFAILFDDIERDMCEEDALRYPSFAHSQVALTNLIYEYLGRPKTFMFCPTEYCASRAHPCVGESPYLRHIGEALHCDIDVMWTGPKVISKTISVTSIVELTAVLKRPPVIWDNLHANDYDSRRLFLGPYSGRPSSLLPHIRGVLTNPNCEYTLNYVAINTLAQWVRRRPTSGHSLMEVEPTGGAEPSGGVELSDHTDGHFVSFEPSEVLEAALKEWIVEFHVSCRKPDTSLSAEKTRGPQDQRSLRCEQASDHLGTKTALPFSLEDLRLLVDFFYLPFQHGPKACTILEEFTWLKENAPGHKDGPGHMALRQHSEQSDSMTSEDSERDKAYVGEKVTHWMERAKQFRCLCVAVNDMYQRLTTIPNRPILYDLYHYVWEAKETTSLLNSYLSWLEAGGSEVSPEREPYVRKGGIVADMQRLLPQMNSCEELFNHHTAPPPSPSSQVYAIRPYTKDDKGSMYQACLETGRSGDDASCLYPNYPELLGDRFVGPYCMLSPDLSFVLEDSEGVCGYVVGVLDSQKFYEQLIREWLPSLSSKYSSEGCKLMNGTEQVMFKQLMTPEFFLPPKLQKDYPSHIRINLMARAQGQGIAPRMVSTVLSTLKAKGSCGVHMEMEMDSCCEKALQFYTKLGFTVIDFSNDPLVVAPPPRVVVVVRQL